jgi:hypothetical protein
MLLERGHALAILVVDGALYIRETILKEEKNNIRENL